MSKMLCYLVFISIALLTCSLSVRSSAEGQPTPVKAFGVTLTAAQAEQFKAIVAATEPERKAIRENAALSATEKQTQMQAVYEKIKQQLKAILTPEQIAEMEKAPPANTPAPVKVFGVTLTAAQAEQFKAINAAAEPEKKAIRENAALSEAEKRTQMQAVYEKIRQQIKAILTPEQIAEMEKTPPENTPAPVKVFGVMLTAAQAEQFKAINTAAEPEKKAIRENAALSETEKKTQMQAVYEKIKQQLIAILTPEQIAEMEKAPPANTPAPVKVFGVILTAAQAEQFKAINAATEPERKAIRENAALSEAEKRTQMQAVYEKIKQQLKAILTPEQIAEMEKATTVTNQPKN